MAILTACGRAFNDPAALSITATCVTSLIRCDVRSLARGPACTGEGGYLRGFACGLLVRGQSDRGAQDDAPSEEARAADMLSGGGGRMGFATDLGGEGADRSKGGDDDDDGDGGAAAAALHEGNGSQNRSAEEEARRGRPCGKPLQATRSRGACAPSPPPELNARISVRGLAAQVLHFLPLSARFVQLGILACFQAGFQTINAEP